MMEFNIYRYFLKPDKMIELKSQFYKLTCSRDGDQEHLNKLQLIHFLSKEGLDLNHSAVAYFDLEIFKQQKKSKYNCKEALTLADRLSVNPEVQKQYRKIFDFFDEAGMEKITAFQLKKVMNKCPNGKKFKGKQVEDIFNDLDMDQDGLVSFEDFLCAMITK